MTESMCQPKKLYTLGRMLKIADGEKLAIVGCGGKTTLINSLAAEFCSGSVLVMPTTKIYLPPENAAQKTTLESCLTHIPAHGAQYLGIANFKKNKLCAPPKEYWQTLAQGYNLVLMEADGSRGLPCKGWLENEPPVPVFASRTIGVVTLCAIGKPADETTVLHLPQFCRLTGLLPGGTITCTALASMVGQKNGMFKNAAGETVLCINRIETPQEFTHAEQLAKTLRTHYPGHIQRIFAGSCAQNLWQEI